MTNARIEFSPASSEAGKVMFDQLQMENGSIMLIADLQKSVHLAPGEKMLVPTGLKIGHADGSVICLIEVRSGRPEPDYEGPLTGTFLIPRRDGIDEIVIPVVNETEMDLVIAPSNGIAVLTMRSVAEHTADEIAGGGLEVSTPISYRPQHIDAAVKPDYQTEHASGFDLRADIPEDVTLAPGASMLVPTGMRIALRPGTEGQIRPRSGLAGRHQVAAFLGTIDADYRGELKVMLMNHGAGEFVVKPGERVAQFVVAPVLRAAMIFTDNLGATDRGEGGFGSTGR